MGRSTGLLASNMEHISNDVYDFAYFEAIPFQAGIISPVITKASPSGAHRTLGILLSRLTSFRRSRV
jgi:hypothetical protein